MINKNSRIFVAGHKGMVGSAIVRKLKDLKYKKIFFKNRTELDLTDQAKVYKYLNKIKPDAVILAAARVGGIEANNIYRAEFIFQNLSIQNNVIHGSYKNGVKNLIFLGSSCIYPKNINKPIPESLLLAGNLEETNDAYAIAKIAGLTMCKNYSENYKLNYKSLMPCNMYGPGDSYDLKNSHFFSALLKKIYLASKTRKKKVVIWGTGKPKRELLYVDDFADAVLFFLNNKIKHPFLNIGTGKDYTIKWYANFISKQLNTKIKFKFNKKMPDGIKRKVLNINLSKKYGWKAKTSLIEGFKLTFADFLSKQ